MEVPSGLTAKPIIDGNEIIFAFRGSDGIPVKFTANQLKFFIGSGLPADFFTSDSKVDKKYMISQGLSQTQFQQLTSGGVLQDIEHNMTWFNAAVKSVGAEMGWGSVGGTNPVMGTPVVTFGTSTSSSIMIISSRPAGATILTYYRLIGSAWTQIASGNILTFTDEGLTTETAYQYRVIASGSGYQNSLPGTGNKSTLTGTGVPPVDENGARLGLPVRKSDSVSYDNNTGNLVMEEALGYGIFRAYIEPDADGWIKGTCFGIGLNLHNNTEGEFLNPDPIVGIGINRGNNRLGTRCNYDGDSQNPGSVEDIIDATPVRIRFAGANMAFEYIPAGQTEYSVIGGVVPRPNVRLYFRLNEYFPIAGSYLNDVKVSGFLTDNTIS